MPRLAVAEVAAIGAVAEPTAAALSQFEDLGAAALSQCAAQAIGVTAIAAGIGATVSVRRRSARRLSALLRREPTAVLRLRRLRQLDLPRLLIRIEALLMLFCGGDVEPGRRYGAHHRRRVSSRHV